MSTKRIDLLIIDPQFDFCDQTGALFVKGADEDMKRLAAMIKRMGNAITQIHVTMDCHYLFDIAHPLFWKNSKGENPSPFSIISYEDVVEGKWFPFVPSFPKHGNSREYAKKYTKALADSGKYALCIWPPHCLIGMPGNNIYPALSDALDGWQRQRPNNIDFVTKGSNILTEHYSAIKAEVPDEYDPTTGINVGPIRSMEKADIILAAGEAGSHCWKETISDVVDNFSDSGFIKKLVMLEDAVSPVPKVGNGPDFPAIQEQFVQNMKSRGMRLAKTSDF